MIYEKNKNCSCIEFMKKMRLDLLPVCDEVVAASRANVFSTCKCANVLPRRGNNKLIIFFKIFFVEGEKSCWARDDPASFEI